MEDKDTVAADTAKPQRFLLAQAGKNVLATSQPDDNQKTQYRADYSSLVQEEQQQWLW